MLGNRAIERRGIERRGLQRIGSGDVHRHQIIALRGIGDIMLGIVDDDAAIGQGAHAVESVEIALAGSDHHRIDLDGCHQSGMVGNQRRHLHRPCADDQCVRRLDERRGNLPHRHVQARAVAAAEMLQPIEEQIARARRRFQYIDLLVRAVTREQVLSCHRADAPSARTRGYCSRRCAGERR